MAVFVSKKYSYATGYGSKVSAQTVGESLERISESGEKVTAQSFLDFSRDVDSPTHGMFEWDDSIAAERYRLHQASTIICHLECTEEVYESEPTQIELEEKTVEPIDSTYYRSAYVNVAKRSVVGRKAEYVPITIAMREEDTRSQVLENAFISLRAFERSYSYLQEMALVIDAIHETDEMVHGKKGD